MTRPSGVRVDGPSGRRFLWFLSLTAALPLRVVVGGCAAGLYKTKNNHFRRGKKPPKAAPSRRLAFMTDYLKSARYRDSSPVAWGRREGRSHNAGSFLRKQLGEDLRNTEELSKDLTLLSSVAYGATPFLRKGAPALRHAAIVTQVPIP